MINKFKILFPNNKSYQKINLFKEIINKIIKTHNFITKSIKIVIYKKIVLNAMNLLAILNKNLKKFKID